MASQTLPTVPPSSCPQNLEVSERRRASPARLSCCGPSCRAAAGREEQEAGWTAPDPPRRTSASSVFKKILKLSSPEYHRQQVTAMEKFVNKRSCINDARSPQQKKIKLESDDERMKQEEDEEDEFSHPVPWQKIEAEGLDCDYAQLFSKEEADHLLNKLEEEVVYATGEESKVHVFGKMHNIPRKQATCGDAGLTYTYSGVKRLACPWTPTLEYIRDAVTKTTGQTFNFVLVNRYKDGQDHMGEHRDDEKELDPLCPIASVSLGAPRDFIFRHRDARGKESRRQIDPVKLELAHGSLLLMNSPTNTFWYHSLPVRKKVSLPRINLTFRRILLERKK